MSHVSREKGRGFTLIEIMLVVMIIGILAGFAVPRFARRGVAARITKAKADVSTMCTLLDSFQLDTGRYPTTDEGLKALMERPGSLPPTSEWVGPYMRELPNDPWGKPYQYRCPGEVALDYDLWSYGPDGVEGGGDDIWNVQKSDDAGR